MGTDDPWDENDGEELEAEIMRAAQPFGADLRGTTPEEAETDLSIDDALARERPEGRTIDEVIALEDEGALDAEGELVADDSLEKDDFASPEESAVSIRGAAPGATDHEDPHADDEG
jgi:hypothetical protein